MRLIRFSTCLLVLISIFGCANKMSPVDRQSIAGQSITIVPTGDIKYDVSSNRGGAGFGLLGVLLESAVAGDGNASSAVVLTKELAQKFIFDISTQELKAYLTKSGSYKSIAIANRALSDKAYSEWNADQTRAHLLNNPEVKSDLALEVSFARIGISKELGGYYATGFIGLKLVDVKTGKLLGSSSDYGVGMTSGVAIGADEDKPNFINALKVAFETLIKKLSYQAASKLFNDPK